jgi:hypothetical protein
MKVTTISLIIALNFPVATTAFQFFHKTVEDGHVSQACAKALTAGIECHEYINAMNLNHYQKWVGDVKLADEICSDTCSDSFRSWNDTVAKDCAEEINSSDSKPRYTTDWFMSAVGYYWQGFNETCVKDTQSNRYCQGQ